MPGSWCSVLIALPALFLPMSVAVTQLSYGIAAIVFAVLGLWSVVRIQAKWGHDPNVVVIDEAVGMSITFLFPAASSGWAMWACAVFLFRVFDVVKPWPIGAINDRTEAWAVLGDDVLAGLVAGVGVQLVSTVLMALGIIDPRLFAL